MLSAKVKEVYIFYILSSTTILLRDVTCNPLEGKKIQYFYEETEDFFDADYSFNLRENAEFFIDRDLDREVNRL